VHLGELLLELVVDVVLELVERPRVILFELLDRVLVHHFLVDQLVERLVENVGQLGRAAQPGDDVSYDGIRFDVLEVDGNRIERMAVNFLERPARRPPDDFLSAPEDEIE
jgi:hypothetical protein